MGRIFVRNFGDDATEDDFRSIFRKFDRNIENVDFKRKTDEDGNIISCFCYLTINDDNLVDKEIVHLYLWNLLYGQIHYFCSIFDNRKNSTMNHDDL